MKRFAIAALVPVLLARASAAAAFDLAFGAYLHLPFDDSGTVVGLSARPMHGLNFEQELTPSSGLRETGLHVRSGTERAPVVLLNGVSLHRPQAVHQDASANSGAGETTGWHYAASTATGVGLIAAIANADSGGVSTCSGTKCPPPKPEPDESAEE